MFTQAITRLPGRDFANGITTANLGRPDFDLILRQHQSYVEILKSLGLEVLTLPALDGFPDAYFVEDAAIVVPELAIITNPGVQARKGEVDTIETALKAFRKTIRINAPATIDGGDILLIDKHLFIGISERTNDAGADSMIEILKPYGYTFDKVPVKEGLHFKSSVNYVGKNTLLISEIFAELPFFTNYNQLVIEKDEEYACNTLLINSTLITPTGYPKTRKKLETLGLPIIETDTSELRKMDGGLTCMSLRF